jgi:mannosyltransferase OCH1-like enzyme
MKHQRPIACFRPFATAPISQNSYQMNLHATSFKRFYIIPLVLLGIMTILWLPQLRKQREQKVQVEQDNSQKQHAEPPKPEVGNALKGTQYSRPSQISRFSWESVISEAELYEFSRSTREIPKIIHQSWKSIELTGDFKEWSQLWKSTHPNYAYLLWNDDDNRLLLERFYPWALAMYDMLPRHIMRIDLARTFYLHRYGGLYVDLDMLAVKNHNDLFQRFAEYDVILGMIAGDEDFEHDIPNAWMASKPGSDFWLLNINLAAQRSFSYPHSAETVTGPVVLKDSVRLWGLMGKGSEIKLLEPGLIYGIDWRKGESYPKSCWINNLKINHSKTMQECFDYFPRSYAITVWTHSWE